MKLNPCGVFLMLLMLSSFVHADSQGSDYEILVERMQILETQQVQ